MTKLYIVEQNAAGVGGHYYSYTRCIAEAAISLGIEPVLLLNRRFVGDWALGEINTVKAFTLTWGEAEGVKRRTWGVGNLAYEYARATAGDPPRPGDHVLAHTLGFAELIALLDYLTSLAGRAQLPTIHILMRYDPSYMLDDIDTFEPLFERVAASPALQRVLRFHADTDALSNEFARLSKLPVSTLPIPFDQRYLQERPPIERDTDLVTVTYLGDARLEKGYGLLPEAIAALRGKIDRRVRFVLQSNFNTPGGEPGMREARDRLAGYPEVEIVQEPQGAVEYYRRLAEADAILLPYDPQRYAARSSGILIEAMAAGKPVLTSAGSWMATQVTSDHAVLFDGESELAPALLDLVTRFEALAERAKAIAERWQTASTGRAFVEALNATAAPAVSEAASKRVLVVMNGDAMVLRNGASRVALTQFAYLQKAGYSVAALFLGYDAVALAGDLERWRLAVTDRIRSFDLEAVHAMILDETARREWRADPRGTSIEADLDAHRSLQADVALRAYLRAHPIDCVLLNYVTAAPVVETLGLADVPVVCETHDLQSLQKAIYGRRAPSDADLAAEFAALARCRHIVSLNPDEADRMREKLTVPVSVTGVYPPPMASAFDALAGCSDLAEVAACCRPSVELFDAAEHLRGWESLDLLFVGSNHLPNVEGLRWFLDEVFIPQLAPHGTTLAVAGSVTDYEEWPQLPGLVYLGRVADLDPLYAAARIVVLPILSGAGSPVKTVEALAQGKAMVATRLALRGIDPTDWRGVAVADNAAGFARCIRDLLADPEHREREGRAAADVAATLADPGRYEVTMDAVFGDVLGEGAPRAAGKGGAPRSAPRSAKGSTVEWSASLGAVNRLLKEVIAGHTPSALLGGASLSDAAAGAIDEWLTQLVDSLVRRRTALALRSDAALLRAAAAADPAHVLATAHEALDADGDVW